MDTRKDSHMEHAKHLRLIHFSLVVASFVLIVSAAFGRSAIYERALEQANAIVDNGFASEDLQDLYGQLVRRAVKASSEKARIASAYAPFERSFPIIHVSALGKTVSVPVDLIWELTFNTDAWPGALGIFPQSAVHENDEFALPDNGILNTLGDFKYAWDNLYQLRVFHAVVGLRTAEAFLAYSKTIPTSAVRLAEVDALERAPKWEIMKPDNVTIEFPRKTATSRRLRKKIELTELGDFVGSAKEFDTSGESNRAGDAAAATYGFEIPVDGLRTPGDMRLIIPVDYTEIPFDGQTALLERLPIASIKKGLFEESFSALDDVSGDVEGINLWDLSKFLARQSELRRQNLPLFGISTPGTIIANWGGFVLAAILAYMVVHIRAFRRKYGDVRLDDFPWIALYDDSMAGLLVFLSLFALPIVAIVLAWVTSGNSVLTVFWTAQLVSVIGLACLAMWEMRRLWRI